jgi:hypothetical protein
MAKQASGHMKKLNAIYDELPTRFQNALESKALKSPKRPLLRRCTANLARKSGTMKKLIGIGASVCYLVLVVKFNRVPNCTSLEAACIAARFAGGATGVMIDPFAMLMMLVCLALGVRRESSLFASVVSTAFSIQVAITSYSYWVETNVI